MKSTPILFLAAALGSLFISMAPSFLVVNRPLLTKNELREAYRRLSIYGNR
jgi:hypothetical protein